MIKSLALGGDAVVLLTGCAKQPVSSGSGASAPAPGGAGMAGSGTADGGAFGSAGGAGGSGLSGAARPSVKDFVPAPDLADIHFDFDRSEIREVDAKTLDNHVGWLKAHGDNMVLIEGHCDEHQRVQHGARRPSGEGDDELSRLARGGGVPDHPHQLWRGAAGLRPARRRLLGQESARPLHGEGPLGGLGAAGGPARAGRPRRQPRRLRSRRSITPARAGLRPAGRSASSAPSGCPWSAGRHEEHPARRLEVGQALVAHARTALRQRAVRLPTPGIGTTQAMTSSSRISSGTASTATWATAVVRLQHRLDLGGGDVLARRGG